MYYSFDPTVLGYLLTGFFALAALGVVLGVVGVADLVVGLRRSGVARSEQPIRTERRELVASH